LGVAETVGVADMPLNLLTSPDIDRALRENSFRKLFDGGGLFLLIAPPRQPGWRLKYRFGGKERGISLGVYPEVTLKRAREKRDEARRLLSDGIDPSADRQAVKAVSEHTFRKVATEWLDQQRKVLAPETVSMIEGRLDNCLYPALGSKGMDDIKAPDLLAVLRRIEGRGTHETAHRVRSLYGRIARYAIATGKAERDVSQDLRGALTPVTTEHFAAIVEPKRVGELLRAIWGYEGHCSTEFALRLAPYLFVRPGELRGAEWAEFDLDGDEPVWRIPAKRMKMGREHLVPLARQAVELLNELRTFTGDGRLLFPGLRTPERPISDNTLNAGLRRIGFSHEEMTAHGFRSMASTLLNEQGFPPDVIELQLAHQDQNATRDAYNRAQRLPQRREMMQAWADYLDGLRARKDKKQPETRATQKNSARKSLNAQP